MERKYPNLCHPITIGNVTFRNRMFSAPMGGTDITNDGCIGPKSTAFYELRAKGGAGAVTVSECMVHPETDGSHAYHLNTGILNSLAAATYTADAIRRHGAIPSLELSHSGMYAGTYMTDKNKKKSMSQWGPSDTVRSDGVKVKALTREMMKEIVKCLRCFTCMAERASTSTRRCTVNPLIGREMEGTEIHPARIKKNVLVAGGGPGGLYAAYTAACRGHKVILCEKEAELGGILKSEQALPFKQEMYELTDTYALMAKQAGVEIRLNTEVTKEYVQKEQVDALIIAVGSSPLVPPLPGISNENVIIVNNYYLQKEKIGNNVVVLGGGLAGCECAIHLGMEGKNVHLVEMRDELAIDANVRHRPLLLKEIEKYVTVHTGCKGMEVTKDGVFCEDKHGKRQLVPGSSVICALGQRSRTETVEELRDAAPYTAVIGDASKVSTITNAVYWGYHAALDI